MTTPDTSRNSEASNLIRLAEGAALIRLHPRTLRRYIAQGRLTGWQMPSGHFHVDKDEVLGLAKPVPVGPTSDASDEGAA